MRDEKTETRTLIFLFRIFNMFEGFVVICRILLACTVACTVACTERALNSVWHAGYPACVLHPLYPELNIATRCLHFWTRPPCLKILGHVTLSHWLRPRDIARFPNSVVVWNHNLRLQPFWRSRNIEFRGEGVWSSETFRTATHLLLLTTPLARS